MSDPKYTVRLLYDVDGWAYHRRCLALQKYAPDDFRVTIGGIYGAEFKRRKYDLALQLCYDSTDQLARHIKRGGYDIVLVSGLNIAWASARGHLEKQQTFADWTVFNSRLAWSQAGEPERTCYISNGVDREVFYPREDPARRTPKVLSIGSMFHRKNKGFVNILVDIEKRLQEYGVPCDFRCVDSHSKSKRMNQEEIAGWYNTGTIYLVASQREGTPNPALEAASSGCVVVATEVGNMPELITDRHNGRLVARDVGEIVDAILDCRDNYRQMWANMEPIIGSWHWKVRAQEYYDLFRRLIDQRRAGVTSDVAVASR
jgi:glycosyltransferase involved in cell wall biosynthesis